MSADKGWTQEESARVLEELADLIEATEPAELAKELREGGHDLLEVEGRMKAAALAGIKNFKQQGLHRARERYRESSVRIERQARTLKGSTADRRRRLFNALEANPGLRSSLTVQHRDFNEMTEEDVDSALEEIEILGVLEDVDDDAPY